MAPNYEDLALFNRQLAELLRSELPLPQAVANLAREVRSPSFAAILASMRRALEDGADLRQALEPHRAQLPEIYVRMVEAGAQSGNLADTLDNFADYAESRLTFARHIREATAYPLLTLAFFIPILLVLLYYVGPELSQVRERETGWFSRWESPAPTWLQRWMKRTLDASHAVSEQVAAAPATTCAGAAAILLVAGLGLRLALRAARVRYWLHALTLRLPVLGPIHHYARLGLILRGLGAMLKSGMSATTALELAAASMDNTVARRSLEDLARRARDGQRLSDAMANDPFFPPFVSWLLARDEGGPRFPATLAQVGEHYRGRLERRSEAIKLLILPTAEVLLGLLVLLAYATFVLPFMGAYR